MNKEPGAFTNGIDWSKVKQYKPGEEPSPFGVKVDYDPEVEKMNQSFEADFAEKHLEDKIEKQPEEVLADASMPEEAKEEAAQVLDGDSRTNEANNDKVETAVEKLSEDFDTVDDLAAYLDSFDEEGNPFFPEDAENPDAVWNKYESPAEAYRNYVNPEDEEKWEAYQQSKEQPVEEAEANLKEAMANPLAAAQKVLNEELPGGNAQSAAIASSPSVEDISLDDRMSRVGGSFSHSLANLGTGSGQSAAPGSAAASPVADHEVKMNKSVAGGGEMPSNLPDSSISTRNAPSNGFAVSNGGSYNSSGVKHTGGSLKVQRTSLPSGESREQAAQTTDLEDATVSSIETRVREIKPETLAEQLGFKVGDAVSYNGTAISNCTPAQLNDIEKILETLGV